MYAAFISLPRSHYGTTETLVCRSALKTKTKKITALGEKTQKNINCKTPRPDSGRSGDCPQSNGGSSAFVQRVLPPSHSGSKHRRGGPSKHADMISIQIAVSYPHRSVEASITGGKAFETRPLELFIPITVSSLHRTAEASIAGGGPSIA
jgi:hypothetical protein